MAFGRGRNPNSLKNLKKPWNKDTAPKTKGRPKGESLTAVLNKMMEKKCPVDEKGRKWKEVMVQATLALAMKGNATAIAEVWNRFDGKIKDNVEHSGTVDIRKISVSEEEAAMINELLKKL